MTQQTLKKKKPGLWYIAAAAIAALGACMLLYPLITNLLYKDKVAAQKAEFLERVSQGTEGAEGPYEELYRLLKSKNISLYETGQDRLVDVFSYETAGVDLSEYGIEDNCIGFVEIPAINIEMPVYLGANQENMSKGAVHMTQTSYPIGGENTNAVIAAHRGGVEQMLRNIHRIQIGDEVVLTNFRERLVYRAAEIRIISPSDIDKVMIQDGRDLITLLSCNPIGRNYQRYVLHCERVG